MRIIKVTTIRGYGERHPDARAGLESWLTIAHRDAWAGPVEVRESFRTADTVGEFIFSNTNLIVHSCGH